MKLNATLKNTFRIAAAFATGAGVAHIATNAGLGLQIGIALGTLAAWPIFDRIAFESMLPALRTRPAPREKPATVTPRPVPPRAKIARQKPLVYKPA